MKDSWASRALSNPGQPPRWCYVDPDEEWTAVKVSGSLHRSGTGLCEKTASLWENSPVELCEVSEVWSNVKLAPCLQLTGFRVFSSWVKYSQSQTFQVSSVQIKSTLVISSRSKPKFMKNDHVFWNGLLQLCFCMCLNFDRKCSKWP